MCLLLRRPQGDGYSFLPAAAATDSAAKVRAEAQGTAELVWAVTDSLAWCSH